MIAVTSKPLTFFKIIFNNFQLAISPLIHFILQHINTIDIYINFYMNSFPIISFFFVKCTRNAAL